MKLTKDQISFAASQIACIDSGEVNLFIENVNSENQIDANVFSGAKMAGVFFSFIYGQKLRIHIAFDENTGAFNTEIASLVRSSMNKASLSSCDIWVKNENREIIEFLKKEFDITPNGAEFYASIEFIMRRERFEKADGGHTLDIRTYEEEHIDNYLCLLDGAMTFGSAPPNFRERKEHFLRFFAELCERNSFEAFWEESELIGLYWRKNAEIDTLAVADTHQRKGYGSVILTRAIEMVFQNTAEAYAYLYAVDWNVKGQAFYKKYGMEQNGHSYGLNINNAP